MLPFLKGTSTTVNTEQTDQLTTAVAETAAALKQLTTNRAEAVKARDAAAWSLHTYGDPDGTGVPWTHTNILAHFGTASHDAWTKSRKRMRDTYPDRKPPFVPDAPTKLREAVAVIRATDGDVDAPARYAAAVAAAAAGGVTQSAIAAAAGVSRQAVNTMLKRQQAA